MSFVKNLKEKIISIEQEYKKFLVSEEVSIQRIEICNRCEQLFHLTRNCKRCGCFVDAKVKLKSASCPLNKW